MQHCEIRDYELCSAKYVESGRILIRRRQNNVLGVN